MISPSLSCFCNANTLLHSGQQNFSFKCSQLSPLPKSNNYLQYFKWNYKRLSWRLDSTLKR